MSTGAQTNPIYIYAASTVGAFLLVALIFVAGDIFLTQSFALHGDETPQVSKVWMAGFTVLGIISKKIYDRIHKTAATSEKAAAVQKLTFGYFFKSILMALFVSPFVIISLYKTLADIPDEVLVFMLCYQNGFFWQSVTAGKDP